VKYLFIIAILATGIAHADVQECKSPDLAKDNFIQSCVGFMQSQGLQTNGETKASALKEQCTCAANAYPVEKIAKKNCEADLMQIDVLMGSAKIRTKCR